MAESSSRRKFAVLCHGIAGHPSNLSCLQQELGKAGFVVLASDVNAATAEHGLLSHPTFGGVDPCGKRLKDFFIANVPEDVDLYVFGHSFGGVYSRYALGLLEKENVFQSKKWVPKLFLTTASPHMGTFENGFLARKLGDWLAGKTGEDLNLRTNVLVEMADSPFTDALLRFEKLVLFGNIQGDSLVGPVTSLISSEIQEVRKFTEPKLLSVVKKVQVQLHQLKESHENADENHKCFVCEDKALELEKDCPFIKRLSLDPDVAQKVATIFKGLSRLPWVRYPVQISEGNAHVCIICHYPKDPEMVGKAVVEQIISVFKSV